MEAITRYKNRYKCCLTIHTFFFLVSFICGELLTWIWTMKYTNLVPIELLYLWSRAVPVVSNFDKLVLAFVFVCLSTTEYLIFGGFNTIRFTFQMRFLCLKRKTINKELSPNLRRTKRKKEKEKERGFICWAIGGRAIVLERRKVWTFIYTNVC